MASDWPLVRSRLIPKEANRLASKIGLDKTIEKVDFHPGAQAELAPLFHCREILKKQSIESKSLLLRSKTIYFAKGIHEY